MHVEPAPFPRALVAEDSAVNQRITRHLLEACGYEVTMVENGRQAVEAVRQQEFDVVLMDVEMPEMDGLTATRVIRLAERGAGRRVPIVAVTSSDNRRECLQAGMDAFLSKAELARQLRPVLGRVLGSAA